MREVVTSYLKQGFGENRKYSGKTVLTFYMLQVIL